MFLNDLPDVEGYLILNEDGIVRATYGNMTDAENVANIVTSMVTSAKQLGFDRLNIVYPDFSYEASVLNKEITIVKKKAEPCLGTADVSEKPRPVPVSSDQNRSPVQ